MPVPLHQAKAELFRTLGHPVRIPILELLAERDHAVRELLATLQAEVAMERRSLSQQLAVLCRTGLVHQQRVAGEVVYSIVVPGTTALLAAARQVLRELLADAADIAEQLS